MAQCAACDASAAISGWLCDDCAAAIHGAAALLPEQITSHAGDGGAVLLDRWGRSHRLAQRTVVGRQHEPNGVAIAQASISRFHAELLQKRDGTWWLVDLASSNGTTVDDEVVVAPRPLASRSAVFFGEIGFYFVAPDPGPPPIAPRVPTTQRPPVMEASTSPSIIRIYDDDDDGGDGAEIAGTFSGLSSVDLTLAAPSGGGGGVVEVGGKSAQITEVQYELLRVLVDRMQGEDGRDERVRGFVRSSELLASLPWDTARPEDNHIKQLVRRVRRTLVRAGIGDLIESRQGFGYRLRVRVRKRSDR
jgi:hypothetical protein